MSASRSGARGGTVGLVVLAGGLLCAFSVHLNLVQGHEPRAIALTMLAGLSFLIVGAYTTLRRPATPVGGHMMWVAIALFLEDWQISRQPAIFTLGMVTTAASTAALGHLLLAYPTGRLRGIAVPAVAASYLLMERWNALLVAPHWFHVGRVTDAAFNATHFPAYATFVFQAEKYLVPVGAAAYAVIMALRYARATPPDRNLLLPAYAPGMVCVLAAFGGGLTRLPGVHTPDLQSAVDTVGAIAFLLWPYTFALGTLAQQSAQQRAEVERSRARIVSANLDARRKVERDIHDGAQQHLVALAVRLRLVEADLAAGRATSDDVARCAADLETALAELRELSRGLHPALVTDFGLGSALGELAHRSTVPVTVRCDLVRRLDPAIEVAVYFAVSEALTNTARHAQARQVCVEVRDRTDVLSAEVYDDGCGGADPTGNGLRGVADRIAGLGGRLTIESPPGRGTALRIVVPTERALA